MIKSELRQHIIKVASELFYLNGYNATGINEIIAKAGIAKATLYSHFSSKDELCVAHLKFRNAIFMEELESHINARPDSIAQLLGIFDYLRERYFREDFNGCWNINCFAEINSQKNVSIKEEIQRQKLSLIAFLSKLISHHLPHNSIAETDKLSSSIYLFYESAICESNLHKNDWPIYTAKQITKNLLPKSI